MDLFGGPSGECSDSLPPVEASDLVSYLVLQTAEQFKAYKLLDAYNQFIIEVKCPYCQVHPMIRNSA